MQVDSLIKAAFSIALVIAFVADTVLLLTINKKFGSLSNAYYSFNKKIGLLKISVLKIVLVIWIIYGLIIEPSGKSGAIFTIITAYWINLIKIFADYKKARFEHKGNNAKK